MNKIEYELRFANINKDEIRKRLRDLNFRLVFPETLTKRFVFRATDYDKNGVQRWFRVRSIMGKTTLTAKELIGKQRFAKELETVVGDFEETVQILKLAGLVSAGYQEMLRESWKKDGAEIDIDTWPGINPSLEIETKKESDLESVATLLGLNINDGTADNVDIFYKKQTGKFLSDFEFVSFEKMILGKKE